MEWLTLTAAGLLLLAIALYQKYRLSYWTRRGIPSPTPMPFVGNMGKMLFGRESFSKGMLRLTRGYPDSSYCGVYQWTQPILMVWDPEMAKQIVCKDFSSFHDRGQKVDDQDPLSQHLFNLEGTKWRNLRNKLSPTFTSGKLKLMLPLMREVGNELSSVVAAEAKQAPHREVDVSALLTRFATDVIGTCAFGIQCNCLNDDNNEFLVMSRKLFRMSPMQVLRVLLESIHPKLAELLPFKYIFPTVHHFFLNLMKDTVEHREKNKVERNDFVQLMMQLRDADLGHLDPANHMTLTPGVMAAQAFIFFLAGLDNVSNTVSYILSRLAADPELQERVAQEVRDQIRAHDGELSYQALKKMDLVERVLQEGLRLWGPIGIVFRKCNATTQVGDVLVEKGTAVMIVTDRMHLDENIYPDPKRFDPDRHTAEAKELRHPYAYMPFGEGPRICIAERFALLEMKLALVTMVRDFTFAPGPNFEPEPELDPKTFFPRPLRGFRLSVNPREVQA